jgi:hypothetical protein
MRRKIFSISLLVLLAVSFIACSSCTKKEDPAQLEIERLQARNEVQNLMGRFAFYHASGMNFRAAEQLFTTYNDTVIELTWGRFTGKDAAYRAYTVGHRNDDQHTITALKLDVPELTPEEQARAGIASGVPQGDAAPADATPASAPSTSAAPAAVAPAGNALVSGTAVTPGAVGTTPETMTPEFSAKSTGATLHLNALTTPVIEVAGDGETARAVWVCPGMEGMTPAWMKYGCDFKKQDGEWKIWHLHVYGLATGLEAKAIFTPNIEADHGADKPPTTSWEYSNTAAYIPLEPEPPKPYATWDYNKIEPKSYGDPN